MEVTLAFIWSTLTDLVSGYEKGKEKLFTTHIQPLHEAITVIHKDYISNFTKISRALKEQQATTEDIKRFIEKRRQDLAVERDSAKGLASALAKAERRIIRDSAWQEVLKFSQAVNDYLSSPYYFPNHTTYYSTILQEINRPHIDSELESISEELKKNDRVDHIEWMIDKILDSLPNKLSAINESYWNLSLQLR